MTGSSAIFGPGTLPCLNLYYCASKHIYHEQLINCVVCMFLGC